MKKIALMVMMALVSLSISAQGNDVYQFSKKNKKEKKVEKVASVEKVEVVNPYSTCTNSVEFFAAFDELLEKEMITEEEKNKAIDFLASLPFKDKVYKPTIKIGDTYEEVLEKIRIAQFNNGLRGNYFYLGDIPEMYDIYDIYHIMDLGIINFEGAIDNIPIKDKYAKGYKMAFKDGVLHKVICEYEYYIGLGLINGRDGSYIVNRIKDAHIWSDIDNAYVKTNGKHYKQNQPFLGEVGANGEAAVRDIKISRGLTNTARILHSIY